MGRPRPPSGVLPTTVIWGSSWAVAGLLGGSPVGSAAHAEFLIAAAVTQIKSSNFRICFNGTNGSSPQGRAQVGERVRTGISTGSGLLFVCLRRRPRPPIFVDARLSLGAVEGRPERWRCKIAAFLKIGKNS